MEIINKDIQLITLVERFPQLYDKKNVNYKDRIAMENAWLFISGELKIPVADCTARWLSLRNRFSKERNKKIPSGAAKQTEWPLMKYLTFLHPVVKKRRTFGNITIEEESNSSETQDVDTYEENSQSMTENDDCTNYEYLNESDTCTDVPNESLSNLEESFSISDILSKNTLVTERPTTPNVSTFKEIAIPRPSTPEKPTTHNTSTPNRFSLK
ncbi:uncharacterized protein LOC143896733 [Temnothorax americanus]|uniref:uncharacterized protein LOC143896733 n=1 Tax=Temnothorax americanus TaxID=1964332 RepID=UPI004067A1C4